MIVFEIIAVPQSISESDIVARHIGQKSLSLGRRIETRRYDASITDLKTSQSENGRTDVHTTLSNHLKLFEELF